MTKECRSLEFELHCPNLINRSYFDSYTENQLGQSPCLHGFCAVVEPFWSYLRSLIVDSLQGGAKIWHYSVTH